MYICGDDYSVNHCMTCKKGGYVTLRHNSLRDLSVEILSEVCQDVGREPHLLPVTGESLPPGSNTKDGARLDVSARGIWTPLARAFLDGRVQIQMAILGHLSILTLECCHTPGAEYN